MYIEKEEYPLDSQPQQTSPSNGQSVKTKQEDTYGILGKSVFEATQLTNHPTRVTTIDNEPRHVTQDYVPGRINLNVSSSNRVISYTVE